VFTAGVVARKTIMMAKAVKRILMLSMAVWYPVLRVELVLLKLMVVTLSHVIVAPNSPGLLNLR
jgi:hypothetical protein